MIFIDIQVGYLDDKILILQAVIEWYWIQTVEIVHTFRSHKFHRPVNIICQNADNYELWCRIITFEFKKKT